jgi:hypothetical protein
MANVSFLTAQNLNRAIFDFKCPSCKYQVRVQLPWSRWAFKGWKAVFHELNAMMRQDSLICDDYQSDSQRYNLVKRLNEWRDAEKESYKKECKMEVIEDG